MSNERPLLFFDFVDPVSLVVADAIDRAGVARAFGWRGFELRPPPLPMIDATDARWGAAGVRAATLVHDAPRFGPAPGVVPWSRKAHELAELARRRDCYHEVRRAIFRAYFVDGVDIGRIDLLTEVAARAGLDAAEARVALDVDAFRDVVLAGRASAGELGVVGTPALVVGGRRLAGPGSSADLTRWLELAGRGGERRQREEG